jgi:ABC-2 type transport system ATP-binding protein
MNRECGMTVFMTTHNIEEAGDLCHRVGIIDRGRLVAIDTPQALRGSIDARRSVEVQFADRLVAISDLIETNAEIVPFADGSASIRLSRAGSPRNSPPAPPIEASRLRA